MALSVDALVPMTTEDVPEAVALLPMAVEPPSAVEFTPTAVDPLLSSPVACASSPQARSPARRDGTVASVRANGLTNGLGMNWLLRDKGNNASRNGGAQYISEP